MIEQTINIKKTLTDKTILIVDDDISASRALVNTFKFEKFNVLVAKNGEEGLKLALEKHPDIILLDIIMPKMDGLLILGKLREDNWGKDVPVIVLTNLNEIEATARAVKNGAYDFLIKSDWKLEDIVKKVKEKLNLK